MPAASSRPSAPWPEFVVLLVPPTVVVVLGGLLLSWYGYPVGYLAVPSIVDGHAEAAARLQLLAAFVLMTCLSFAVLVYAGLHASRLDDAARRALLGVFAVAAVLSLTAVSRGHPEEVQRFVGEQFVCDALGVTVPEEWPPVSSPAEQGKAAAAQRTRGTPLAKWRPAPACSGQGAERFRIFRFLTTLQRLLLAVVAPALMLALISCALPPPGAVSADDCRVRSERMTTFLYLSAALLVAGLFYLGALLRWPASALTPDDLPSYLTHVSGLILYWGFVYSAYIAACYLPAAAVLAHRCGPNADAATIRPLALLKKSAAIFAPAIAGILGSTIDFEALLG